MHHIGIVVHSLTKNISLYEQLGYTSISQITIDNIQHNKVVFMQNNNNSIIELIEPLDSFSPVYNTKEGYHHICFEISNPIQFLDWFKSSHLGKVFTDYIQAPAIDNRNVIFACLFNGTLVELLF